MRRMGYVVQIRHLTESRRLVKDGRCSYPASPTSFTLNITGMIIVGADVRSPLPEQLLNDSIEWLYMKMLAIQSGTTEYSASAVHKNCRGVFLYINTKTRRKEVRL